MHREMWETFGCMGFGVLVERVFVDGWMRKALEFAFLGVEVANWACSFVLDLIVGVVVMKIVIS